MTEKNDNFEKGLLGAEESIAQFDAPKKSFVSRFQSALHKSPSLVPLIVLVCAIMIFTGWLGPRFLPQMTLVFQQIQIVGILALAQTLVILTAGIDLSVGAIAVFCSVIMGQFTFRYGIHPSMAIACGLAAGAGIGELSGWLVTRIKIPPFIATLGVWQIVLAANYIYSRNETIRARDLREEAPMPELPTMGWLRLQMQNPRDDGMPSSEEYETLTQIDDAISIAIEESENDCVYVGTCTGDGTRDFYFYTTDNYKLESIVGQAMAASV